MRYDAWEKAATKNLKTTKSQNQGAKATEIPDITQPMEDTSIVLRLPILKKSCFNEGGRRRVKGRRQITFLDAALTSQPNFQK